MLPNKHTKSVHCYTRCDRIEDYCHAWVHFEISLTINKKSNGYS